MGIKHPHVGLDDLATLSPEIAAEWHSEKNEGLRINAFVAGSAQNVWWKCAKCGHEWRAMIRSRYKKGSGCPECAKKKRGAKRVKTIIAKKGSLNDPELLKDWDREKNAPYNPSDFSQCSNSYVHWKCHVCGYEWRAKVSNRTHGRNCPACAGKALYRGHNDLATTEPGLAKEWHPTKNGNLRPCDVMRGQARKVWWQCPNGHAYPASLNKRSSDHTSCPICKEGRQTSFREQAFYYYIHQIYPSTISRYKAAWLGRMELDIFIPELRLAIEYDGVAWHHEEKFERERRKYALCREHGIRLWRVKEVMPEDGRGLSDMLFSVPNVETDTGFKSLLSMVLDQIDPEANMWTRKNPLQFHTALDVNIERDRLKIAHYQYEVKNSLLKMKPVLAKEWHPTKNGDWSPNGLSWKSERRVWWICPRCGKEYEMSIAHRTAGSGCPDCARIIGAQKRRQNALKKRELPNQMKLDL